MLHTQGHPLATATTPTATRLLQGPHGRLARSRHATGCSASREGPAPAPAPTQQQQQQQEPVYSYHSHDPRITQKATIEHIFAPLAEGQEQPANEPNTAASPWEMSWQMNERNLVWSDGLRVALIKNIATRELGLGEEEMENRLSQLATLLPGLVPRLLNAPPLLVARAAASVPSVAQRLLALKTAFPSADILAMVSNRLGLLVEGESMGVEQLGRAAKRLRELLPGLNVDRFVADYPLVLDTEDLERALEDVKLMMPGTDPVALLGKNPSLVLGLVKGKNMVPYDQLENPFT